MRSILTLWWLYTKSAEVLVLFTHFVLYKHKTYSSWIYASQHESKQWQTLENQRRGGRFLIISGKLYSSGPQPFHRHRLFSFWHFYRGLGVDAEIWFHQVNLKGCMNSLCCQVLLRWLTWQIAKIFLVRPGTNWSMDLGFFGGFHSQQKISNCVPLSCRLKFVRLAYYADQWLKQTNKKSKT